MVVTRTPMPDLCLMIPGDTYDPDGLTQLLARVRAGEPDARNDLVRAALGRLDALARQMLRRHPVVRRWAETGDLLSAATVRLLRALDGAPVTDTRGFYQLAACVMRRELIDMARRLTGPHGLAFNHADPPPDDHPSLSVWDPDPAALDRWAAFHAAVDALPADEREVFGLTFYHGWPQDRIADQFAIDPRTVRRRWRQAAEALNEAIGGEWPDD